jgi:tRNA threonylcarbamoyladenosine biosynthesis protein TsaB
MNNENVLAIETSTSECSVALQTADGQMHQITRSGNNIHSQVVLPLVKELLEGSNLKLADLAAIGVCRGPGSFTGLRIGIGVAQGLAYGARIPMFGFTSLDVLVNQCAGVFKQKSGKHLVIAALDARMQEVYWAPYLIDNNSDDCQRGFKSGEINVNRPSDIELPIDLNVADFLVNDQITLLGRGWSAYPELLTKLSLPQELMPSGSPSKSPNTLFPLASGLLNLFARSEDQSAVLESAANFAPFYVRNNVAAKPKPSIKSGSAVV